MEFPDLGKHCSDDSCKQLDFLPMKCDGCSKIFCKDHVMYDQHKCPESHRKDNQVPVCPLCNNPVSLKKGQSPDYVISAHIDNDCKSDLAKNKRIYTNRCSAKGCKQKELVPFNCDKCRRNFCLKHRHEMDHNCAGFEDTGRGISAAGAAAVNRTSAASSKAFTGPFNPKEKSKPQQSKMSAIGKDLDRERRDRVQQGRPTGRVAASAVQSVQGGLSEDEAMAQALAASLADSQPAAAQASSTQKTASQQQQEEEDAALAKALAESEREANRPRQQPQKEKSCSVS